MTVSRLPFALEDLEREIRSVCTEEPKIVLTLSPTAYSQVTSELASHFNGRLVSDPEAMITKLGGISIVAFE